MSASIGNEYYPNEIEENGIALEKVNDVDKMKTLQRNRPPIGKFYMKCVRNHEILVILVVDKLLLQLGASKAWSPSIELSNKLD